MAYFTNRKSFICPSFDLKAEESDKIGRFLRLLENSGVGAVVEKSVRNLTASG